MYAGDAGIMASSNPFADGKTPVYNDGKVMPPTSSRITTLLYDSQRARNRIERCTGVCVLKLLHAGDLEQTDSELTHSAWNLQLVVSIAR